MRRRGSSAQYSLESAVSLPLFTERCIHSRPPPAQPNKRLGAMEAGALRADAVIDLAVELRHGKHADPMRGALSAYLYDSIGDIDSIRRMAVFYIQHGQPIPYDIAMLGQLRGRRTRRNTVDSDGPCCQSAETTHRIGARTRLDARLDATQGGHRRRDLALAYPGLGLSRRRSTGRLHTRPSRTRRARDTTAALSIPHI
jgi:hypothetical protein